ncbi:MAG: hypothetical protein J0H15_12425 [Xanthomonadales bacterium]|nr:hypothetical protein [Xanthomonadales bacterium]
MNILKFRTTSALASLCFLAGLTHPDAAMAQAGGGIDVSQQPLFTMSGQPPLNMLVMGKDHKIYYEAYNDASDLDGDGALDIGYKPDSITYYGYFNSNACYEWDAGENRFKPTGPATSKQCSGKWSGDFLNYVTTSRMDALRRVLYGGWRQVDTASDTTLQGAFFPQDGHSWGKEYQSIARDGYDISKYTPLSAPLAGTYHLFAMTTLTGNGKTYAEGYQAPLLRVLKNTEHRIWNWVSIEGPVAGDKCVSQGTNCVKSGTTSWDLVPADWFSGLKVTTWKRTSGSGSPGDKNAMDKLFSDFAKNNNLCGSSAVSQINNTANNPFSGTNGCTNDNFLTKVEGNLVIPAAGTYKFAIDGDDAVDVSIGGTHRADWYGGHAASRPNVGGHSFSLTLTAGSHPVVFRHQEASGGESWGLFVERTTPGVTRDDYQVRVQPCPAGDAKANVREPICKEYSNKQFKPTGILHDYGETEKMYFGLITGSQFNNLEGGVLRRNMEDFRTEINADTGQFKSDVNGIVNTINRFRMIGGGYDGGGDNLNANKNWNWANGTGNCTSQGDRALNNGECRMWGNPLAEMMYESMRYFAGAGKATTRFATGGSSQGTTEETTMGLGTAPWKDPYASKNANPAGGGFLSCSRPFQTVISDINPSYDGDLPGSPFTGAKTSINDTPSTISSFNAATEGQAIWTAEFGGPKNVFIGDVGNVTDNAPTAKAASSFGNIRGLSPEEPSKGGTYYSASVARYARMNDINAAEGNQYLSTYAVALASPLPRIEFPVGTGKVALIPFAKTASGTFGGGVRKPTNTIVDFYVEKIVNLPGQPTDVTINGGRAYARFRINYEDVEQGNDHDMDAIVIYDITHNADGKVTVALTSEYAAGSANQIMGYVLSGTTQDGVYLDVRDTDSGSGAVPLYGLSTPNPLLPGDCAKASPPAACTQALPLTSTRVFTPSAAAADTIQLQDPLWYAAKYGAPKPEAVDLDGDGVPDNYFLVTNPTTLREQLDKAFADIIQQSQPSASVATSTPRYTPGSTLAYEASYNSEDWSGDVKAYKVRPDGTYTNATPKWSASERMPAPGSRNVFTASKKNDGTYEGVEFTKDGLDATLEALVQGNLDPDVFAPDDVIAFLRGDQSKEQGVASCTVPADCPFRKRGSKVGDILNSSPAVAGVSSFGFGSILADVAPTAASSYAAFVEAKKLVYRNGTIERPVIYVGANDGMLHAFDGSDSSNGGKELFSYIPNAVLDKLQELTRPGYMHRYYVDGSPTVGDAYLASAWKTVLLGSVGAGGRGVFALDVTSPANFSKDKVLWEFNSSDDARMGQFVGRPNMGIAENGQWLAVFGNGYNSANNRAVLFIRDLRTGAEVATIDVGCTSGPPENCTDGPNGLATALLVDNDGNGAGDTIYAGDYLGNLWRFEYTGSAWKLGNGNKPLFTAKDPGGKPQSITSGVFTTANPLGGTMVVFGTGRYLNVEDADSSQIGEGTRASVDSIYGIWDTRWYDVDTKVWTDSWPIQSRSVLGGYADLGQQKITKYVPEAADGSGGYREATRNSIDFKTSSADTNGKMGWYIDLDCSGCGLTGGATDPLRGERVTATPQGILGDVVFNVFRPEGDACEPGSQIAMLVFDALIGSASYALANPTFGGAGHGPLLGVHIGHGPPPGEPLIGIKIPPPPDDRLGVPCLPGSEGCTPPPPPCDPATDPSCEPPVTTCSWFSLNAAGKPAGKPVPCGRVSWRQLR